MATLPKSEAEKREELDRLSRLHRYGGKKPIGDRRELLSKPMAPINGGNNALLDQKTVLSGMELIELFKRVDLRQLASAWGPLLLDTQIMAPDTISHSQLGIIYAIIRDRFEHKYQVPLT